jgi:hypothetical protein
MEKMMQDSFEKLLDDAAVIGQIDALAMRLERGRADRDDVNGLCELVESINPGFASFLRINLAKFDTQPAKFATAMLTVWIAAKRESNLITRAANGSVV